MISISRERAEEIISRIEMFGHGAGYTADEVHELARIALAALTAEPVARRMRFKDGPWLYKHNGEDGDATECYEEQMLYVVPREPVANLSLKAMMQALDAFYAEEEVPERGMLLAFRILLDDCQACTQQEARHD